LQEGADYFGGLDVVINNAGSAIVGSVEDLSPEMFQKQEIGPLGIKVSAVEPGGMKTDFAEDSSLQIVPSGSEPKQNTSVWLALRNPAFVALWLPSVVSGVCVAAHDTAATWLINALGASPLLLSLIATAASLLPEMLDDG
jgi:NAD(P)-dependent dehydrogenase (short-subunit alcohol dehydrogenase family)